MTKHVDLKMIGRIDPPRITMLGRENMRLQHQIAYLLRCMNERTKKNIKIAR
jgi:hypothetical protein